MTACRPKTAAAATDRRLLHVSSGAARNAYPGWSIYCATKAAVRALSTTRTTLSPAPNFAYALATERIRDEEMEGIDLSPWRFALCGAETVVPEVLRAFAERFARWGLRPQALKPVYGLSEAALAVTFADLERPFLAVHFDRIPLV